MNLINIVFAQDKPSGIMAAIDSFIPGGIANVFNLGLGIGAILALGTIIYAGILYSVSGDNSSKQKVAIGWIWAAVKGLALIALGVVLINIINPQIIKIEEVEIREASIPEVPLYNPPIGNQLSTLNRIETENPPIVNIDGSIEHKILRLAQGQEPWGDMEYGKNCLVGTRENPTDGTFRTSGCGPAALAMVIHHLAPHERRLSIGQLMVDIGKKLDGDNSKKEDFRICQAGTRHEGITEIPKEFGLSSSELSPLNTKRLEQTRSCLLNNGLVIALVGPPGGGHFIVVRGIDQNNVMISDSGRRNIQPYSINHFLNINTKSWCIKR